MPFAAAMHFAARTLTQETSQKANSPTDFFRGVQGASAQRAVRAAESSTAPFNQDYTGEKFKNIAEALGVDTTGMDQTTYRKSAIDAVKQLSVDVGIPTKLEKLCEEDLDFLAQSAAADACTPGNPREASIDDYKEMFRKLM